MKKLKGVYLVIDPKQNWDALMQKLHAALKGGINIIQIWNHWQEGILQDEKIGFVRKVKNLAEKFHVPVLMHEDYEMAIEAELDGVHFDQLPESFDHMREQVAPKYIGLTVGNDLDMITYAAKQSVSYISFCAIFPSPSVSDCEIVDQQNIKKAREITDIPIFLSGGIRTENINRLSHLEFDGIAVISGILNAADPERAVKDYLEQLKLIAITQ